MFYRYKVKWCFDEKAIISEGLGAADGFQDAMSNIVDQFGESELIDVNIKWISDDMEINFDDLLESLSEDFSPRDTELGQQMIDALTDLVTAQEEVDS